MKRVTFTYSLEFPDETEDSVCISSLIEVMSQDKDFNDDQFKIEKTNE